MKLYVLLLVFVAVTAWNVIVTDGGKVTVKAHMYVL